MLTFSKTMLVFFATGWRSNDNDHEGALQCFFVCHHACVQTLGSSVSRTHRSNTQVCVFVHRYDRMSTFQPADIVVTRGMALHKVCMDSSSILCFSTCKPAVMGLFLQVFQSVMGLECLSNKALACCPHIGCQFRLLCNSQSVATLPLHPGCSCATSALHTCHCRLPQVIRAITMVLGGEAYLNFMVRML